jgi:hypothetical protein
MKYSKILTVFGCLALTLTGYFLGVYAQKREARAPQTWLLSQTSQIKLGVWDKHNTSNSNKVTFVVTTAKGKEYKSEKFSDENDWIYAIFPDDFEPYVENQTFYSDYSWKCVVEGQTVASGRFKFDNFQTDTSAVYK